MVVIHTKTSSLPLQICLFLNKWLLIGTVVFWGGQILTGNTSTAFLWLKFLFFVFDSFRLLLGYHGNLKGQLFSLSAFTVFSFFPQSLLLSLIFLFFGNQMGFVDSTFFAIQFVFLVAGFGFSLLVITKFFSHPSRRYANLNRVLSHDD
ncbi:hypothetical protein GEMRC1_008046 [Eukaryota sp. GEM-RC1]